MIAIARLLSVNVYQFTLPPTGIRMPVSPQSY